MVHEPNNNRNSTYPLGITHAEIRATTHKGKIQRSLLLGLIFQKWSQQGRGSGRYRSVKTCTASDSMSGGFFTKQYCVRQEASGLFVYMVYVRPVCFGSELAEYSSRHEAMVVVNEKSPREIRGVTDLVDDPKRALCVHFIDQTYSLAPDLNTHTSHHEGIPSEAKTAEEVLQVFHEIMRRFS